MSALARIGGCNQSGALREAVRGVVSFLQHEDELTRNIAIGTLNSIGRDAPDISVPALLAAAEDDRLLVPTMHALISVGKPAIAATSLFVLALGHRLSKVRRLGIRGLQAIEAIDATRTLVESCLTDASSEVRNMAAKVLKRPG
jgi:HEAT repeat protein